MTPAQLLDELETISHDARMRRMVEFGRAARHDAETSAALAELERGSFYHRLLALQACHGTRDAGHALRALADPSRALRGRAVQLVARLGDEGQVRQALHRVSARQRLALLAQLRRGGRLAPIDAFLDDLAARGERDLAVLLPRGSAGAVERHFAYAQERGGQVFWTRLARYHPDRALRAFEALLEATGEQPGPLLLWMSRALLPRLADRRPEESLALARRLVSRVPLSSLELHKLSLRRPEGVADLVLASQDRAPGVNFQRLARRLDGERTLALIAGRRLPLTESPAWPSPGGFPRPYGWFRKLPAARRAEVFAAFGTGCRDRAGCVPLALLTLLPREPRQAEARRHLALRALATRRAQRLPYAGLLPWEEALAALEPFLKHPQPELRGLALRSLALALPFERARLADYLTLVRARKNEQDPVRGAMLAALADLPPGAWRAGHLEGLGNVVRDALSAADLSAGTAQQGERLVLGLLPFHPEWAVGWLVTLVRERGRVNLHNLEARLTPGDARRLEPLLLPVLHTWETREREPHLLALAQALGRRLRHCAGVLDVLERVTRGTRTQWVAQQGLGLLAREARPRLPRLIPELVREDASWATQPGVHAYLHRRRQDLLTPFLGRRAYRGRFSTGKTRPVLPLRDGFFRWTAAQQSAFAETLREVVEASPAPRDVPTVLDALRRLPALPAVGPELLVALAGDERLAVRDAAVRALGRLDACQGVATLLDALADDRGRVAIYALRSALLAMPPGRALGLLRAAPLGKVTVAKEVARLAGELATPEALEFLRELDARPLHRDVRVALLRALWDHLERPEAWESLERAAESEDEALLTSVVRVPADRLTGAARRRLLALLARLLGHADPAVRLGVIERCQTQPVDDPEQVLLAPLLEALASPLPDERAAAARAAFAGCTRHDAGRVAEAVARVLPARAALVSAVRALQAALPAQRERLVPVARAVLAVLARDPLVAGLRVELAVTALPWRELQDLLEQLDGEGLGRADVLTRAAEALGSCQRPDAAQLWRLERALAASPSEALRHLALAVLTARARPPHGWDDRCLARLGRYRADPSGLVAGPAQLLFPEEETAEVEKDEGWFEGEG
jgi:hypothetical protein